MAIVPMSILLAGKRPVSDAFSFIAGISIPYYLVGVLIALGLGPMMERLNAKAVEWLKHSPDPIEMVLQIVIGVLLLFLGIRFATARRKQAAKREARAEMTPTQAFMLGAAMTLGGIWGALPYFAAINEILRVDPPLVPGLLVLGWYQLLFILPLVAFVILRQVLGTRAEPLFRKMSGFFSRWGRRLIILFMILLGLLLIADSIAWFMGHPLIDFGD